MKEVTYRCNKCNAVRQEANNWWVVKIARTGGEDDPKQDWRRLEITPWDGTWNSKDEEPEEYERILHLCGHGCAGQVVAGWMDAVTADEALVAAVLQSAPDAAEGTA